MKYYLVKCLDYSFDRQVSKHLFKEIRNEIFKGVLENADIHDNVNLKLLETWSDIS